MKEQIDKSAIRLKAKALKDLYPEEYWRGTVGDLWNVALEEFVVTRQLYREAVIYYGDKWNKKNISISRKIHII